MLIGVVTTLLNKFDKRNSIHQQTAKKKNTVLKNNLSGDVLYINRWRKNSVN